MGSIRRECLDHVVIVDESSLKRLLKSYFDYYHRSRTHLSLENLSVRSWIHHQVQACRPNMITGLAVRGKQCPFGSEGRIEF